MHRTCDVDLVANNKYGLLRTMKQKGGGGGAGASSASKTVLRDILVLKTRGIPCRGGGGGEVYQRQY